MTALQKFLKQIILKKVEGSVYLLPAICDYQIDEALENERKQGGNLPISNVSEQRKLLIAFKNWEVDNDVKNLLPEQVVDFYIDESNS